MTATTDTIDPIWNTLFHFPGIPPSAEAPREIPLLLEVIPFSITGLCWLVVYTLIIRQGFRDKHVGMPVLAVGSNIAWEFTYAFVFPQPPVLQMASLLWFFVVPFMQMMFVITLRIRRSSAGQSMYIAVLKLIGDIPGFIVLMAWFPNRYLYVLLFITEIFFDVLYIVLLRRQFIAEGRPLWRSAPKPSGVANRDNTETHVQPA